MYDFPTTAQMQQAIEAATAPLREQLALVLSLSDEYVSTAKAMKIMDCSRAFLEKERNRTKTLLVCSYNGAKPTYSRASLMALKASRTHSTYDASKE